MSEYLSRQEVEERLGQIDRAWQSPGSVPPTLMGVSVLRREREALQTAKQLGDQLATRVECGDSSAYSAGVSRCRSCCDVEVCKWLEGESHE